MRDGQRANQARDVALIEQYRAGDLTAVETLLGLYKPLVLSRADAYFLPGADREDLIQEGMLGLFAAVQKYELSRGSFAAFADMSVRSHMLDAVKAANRQKNEPLNRSVSLDDENAAFEPAAPGNDAVRHEQLDAFRQFMHNKLSLLEQRVARLYLAGYSYADIARETGKERKSIDNAMSRIRRKLKAR